MTRKSGIQKEKEIELFMMGLCSARWEGAAYVILEVRLKRCSFWLLVLCMLGSFYISLKLCNFEADLVKIKYVSIVMCQLTAETNHKEWIANKTKLESIKSKFRNFWM